MYLTLVEANKLATRYFRQGLQPAIERIAGGLKRSYRVTTADLRAMEQRIDERQRNR